MYPFRVLKPLLFLATAASLHAQLFTFGAKLGAPVNDPAEKSPFSTSSVSRLTGGPFVELHLPLRFSVEFSALYRTSRQNETRAFPSFQAQSPYLLSTIDKVHTWDLPLLLKYHFTNGRIRPYVGAGGAWSIRHSNFEVFQQCLGAPGSCGSPDRPIDVLATQRKSSLTRFGPAASAGFDIRQKYVTISPEVRWNRVFSGGATRDQISIGVGFGFRR